MQADLPFESTPRPSRPRTGAAGRGAARRTVAGVLSSAPLWVPALLLIQLLGLGLVPAMGEARRLEEAEGRVWTRVEQLRAERQRIELDLERLGDPIYRARVARSLRFAGEAPLTLERALWLEQEAATVR